MENFNWSAFTKKIAVKSNLTIMYNAWTKANEIEKWFLETANYFDSGSKEADKEINIQKDFTYNWSWYCFDAVETGKIINANSKDFLQFTFAGDCIVEVKLKEQDDYVIIELTQNNIPTDEISKQNIRLGCASGWAFYLVNLKSVYEGGLDLRNKNEKLKGMINS
jgi:hypothetical protein